MKYTDAQKIMGNSFTRRQIKMHVAMAKDMHENATFRRQMLHLRLSGHKTLKSVAYNFEPAIISAIFSLYNQMTRGCDPRCIQ